MKLREKSKHVLLGRIRTHRCYFSKRFERSCSCHALLIFTGDAQNIHRLEDITRKFSTRSVDVVQFRPGSGSRQESRC